MLLRLRVACVLCFAGFGFGTSAIANAETRQIWFTPSPHADMMPLYSAHAQWQRAAASVQVIKLYAGQILTMPDTDLRRIFHFAKQRGIAMAVEFGPLHKDGKCGPLEGFNPVPSVRHLAERVRALGGTLSYAAMDEPYWYAHIYSGPRQCDWSARQIVENARASVAALRETFPDIAIGDIEPISTIQGNDLLAQYANWIKTWRQVDGTNLAFFDADVNWSPADLVTLAHFGLMLRDDHIPFGIIYNGKAGDLSNAAWVNSATRHFEEYESGSNPLPDQAIFQSWDNYPTKLLPASDPDAFTHLVSRYLRARTMFTNFKVTTSSVSGRLVTSSGQPLSDALVELFGPSSSGSNQLTFGGTVPANAAKMLLAWRVNVECGGCSGQAHLLLDRGAYTQVGRPAIPITLAALHLGSSGDGHPEMVRYANGQTALTAYPDDTLSVNSRAYTVEPGKLFSATVPFSILGPTTRSVVFDIIFLGSDGREVARAGGHLVPAIVALAHARTDKQGYFTIDLERIRSGGLLDLRLRYGGDHAVRATSTLLH